MERCRRDFVYFCGAYCWVETKDDGLGEWVPFDLWPAQREIGEDMQRYKLMIVLKARQLGLTWLCVAFALWLMLFSPIATVLLFSLRDAEAKKLLKRLRGMHARLPAWMQQPARDDSQHELEFANGSTAQALTNAGDSYTASLVIVDEADLLPNLDTLLESLKPTVADGGRMVLVSRADKSKPESPFKRIYRAAKAGGTQWRPAFLPWGARPDRSQEWYADERKAALAASGSLDGFHGNYPATDAEAMSPRTQDKRIPPVWLEQCYREGRAVESGCPSLPGLTVYRTPEPGKKYLIGADPAEGNPTSDESAACVIDAANGEQVAELAGKFQPTVFADYLTALSEWYNRAAVMPERNNHGHAVIARLKERGVRVLRGHDDRDGWLSSSLGKTLLYDRAADAVRNFETTIRSFVAFTQLASIEGSTLRAPDNQHDDRADAYALALAARSRGNASWGPPSPVVHDNLPPEISRWKADGRNVVERAPRGVW